ncbi:ABC transporter ATP-binding protein [Pseudoalteromonas xiamenensis]|uniref:ABC transporter ATP-binding protein n=1 Tax=Pseudoalteromonas xiamenensis TaxID=882626 RepID=UPI0027E49B77|nr:ABC transporter ATP-binding protein [Pseudoalteromonas xiamenensis]WMN61339.1 ABC transporter ATP-binding protein [Pseudoalteromonas xiamenensis]
MITLEQLRYRWPKHDIDTIHIEQLLIQKGERIFLFGPSGTGKSTLLGLLAGIHQPTQGKISILNQDLTSLSNAKRDQFRADHIGTIFQNFNLLAYLNPLENVMLGCHFSTLRASKAEQQHGSVKQAARHLLAQLGISESLLHHCVGELSIGQQQRIAAARAVIGKPELIIADEPTSALDADNRAAFINLLFEQATLCNATLLFVSHDQSLAPMFSRQLNLAEINQRAGKVL